MNNAVVQQLILKDWYLNRVAIFGAIVLGLIALALIGFSGETAFYIGSVLLITAVMGSGIYLVMATAVMERKEKTLPFIMSLPISAREYTKAKVLANMLIFLLPWAILMIGSLVVIAGREALPNGLMPFTAMTLTEIFVAYCLILGVALVSESEGWTVVAIVFCQLFFNFFLYFISHIPSIEPYIEGPTAVWNATVYWTLGLEVMTIVIIIGLTFYFQGRKRDFIC